MNGWKLAGIIAGTLATISSVAWFMEGAILNGICGLVVVAVNALIVYLNR